ncbi:MAG TPA: hypothetical protein VG167_22505 [Verrucomicrobiae bacterium]|nr:hypothetical protein [Verrucomicrobiae bacterium]
MATAPSTPVLPPPAQPAPATPVVILGALGAAARQALLLAFFAQIFGSVALGIVSGIWSQMAPSLPPGLGFPLQLEAQPGSGWHFHWFQQHRFVLLFLLFFAVEVVQRLLAQVADPRHQWAAARLDRLKRRLSENWFQLIVGNAFGAFVPALVMQVVGQYTLGNMILPILGNTFGPVIHTVAGAFHATGLVQWVANLVHWESSNNFKFLFWSLYAASICDDLGLPNLKTMVKWLWRRFTGHAVSDAAIQRPPAPHPETRVESSNRRSS